MRKKARKIIEPMIGYGIVVIILLAIISGIAILGGGIMRLFGFEYTSVKSIILFFAIVAIVGFPIETLVLALPKALLSLDKITIKVGQALFVILDTMSTMFTMAFVDYYMGSVSASELSIFVVSVIIALSSMKDLKK